jgi:transposase
MESFFGSLKTELVHRTRFGTRAEAKAATSKMGRRDIRRLLITGAMTVVRAALRTGKIKEGWLARMLARKPRLVVAIALANKMARSIRAMLVKQEDYRDPAAAPA